MTQNQERLFLDDLCPAIKTYTVKVKVIDKGRRQTSAKRNSDYQTLLLQDSKGNKMRAVLFGAQIGVFEDALQYNGVYMITNAPIKAYDGTWKPNKTEVQYQMTFGRDTVVQPATGQPYHIKPTYQAIATIPRAADPDQKYDVLAVLLYVEPAPRTILTNLGKELKVRELVVLDHSIQQPMVISIWSDLATAACDKLIHTADDLDIAGFTALKISTHKGFSLATSMSTSIIHQPEGENHLQLSKWAADHRNHLATSRVRVLEARNPTSINTVLPLATICKKKTHDTLQDERHWINATINAADLEDIHAYVGCSKCGRRADLELGVTYTCTNCLAKQTIAVARLTFTCQLTDGTETLQVTAFTDDAAKLLRSPVDEIFRIRQADDFEAFKIIADTVHTSATKIQLGPKLALARTNVLQWTIKEIVVEDQTPPKLSGQPHSSSRRKLILDGSDDDTPKVAAKTTGTEVEPTKRKGIEVSPDNPVASTSPTVPTPLNHANKRRKMPATLQAVNPLPTTQQVGNGTPEGSTANDNL